MQTIHFLQSTWLHITKITPPSTLTQMHLHEVFNCEVKLSDMILICY
jgi:hypothetical protein